MVAQHLPIHYYDSKKLCKTICRSERLLKKKIIFEQFSNFGVQLWLHLVKISQDQTTEVTKLVDLTVLKSNKFSFLYNSNETGNFLDYLSAEIILPKKDIQKNIFDSKVLSPCQINFLFMANVGFPAFQNNFFSIYQRLNIWLFT